jgi:hypothetical protein
MLTYPIFYLILLPNFVSSKFNVLYRVAFRPKIKTKIFDITNN